MITLVLGGARSGKSRLAEGLVSSAGAPVTYVATAEAGGDPGFEERIRIHRERRPAHWALAEPGRDLVAYLDRRGGEDGRPETLLIDSLGTWVAAHPDFDVPTGALCAALGRWAGDVVVVSEEVGLAVHPSTESGGRFRDALGLVNQSVSALADRALLVVAGRPLELPAYGRADPSGRGGST